MINAPQILIGNDGCEVGWQAQVSHQEMRDDSTSLERTVSMGVMAVRERLAERVLRMVDGDHWEIRLQSNTQEDRACRMVECKVIGWIDPIKETP